MHASQDWDKGASSLQAAAQKGKQSMPACPSFHLIINIIKQGCFLR